MGIVITVYPTIFPIVLNGKAHVSFNCCFLQMYIFHSLIITENYLLNIMAYDRYIAICKALHYHSIMTLHLSKTLIYLCWIIGFITPLTWVILGYNLPFCGPNEIQHLFCDSSPLLDLACTTNDVTVLIDLIISSFTIILTSVSITATYASILVRILKMKISEDRKKALSTCASSLIISVVFYGSAALMYIQLQRSYSPEYDFATAIHHSFLTPLLSLLVYSFRNKDIKNFLKQLLQPKRVLRESIEREYS
ncbi:olfactory receptor 6N1-like [Hyperolius riggenbachi]|uniref:olfactory receptor 6N1-like n=1 Tax=Hyperolius riggenbachi TaxID=752182 RepID=UPI0035A3812F